MKKFIKFILSSALIETFLFIDIFVSALVLGIEGLFFREAIVDFQYPGYLLILPVLSVLFVNVIFVRLNNRFFQLRLRNIIRRHFAFSLLTAAILFGIGFAIVKLVSLIPEETLKSIGTVIAAPFAILIGITRGFIIFPIIGLIITLLIICFAIIFVYPVLLFITFKLISIYERGSRKAKKVYFIVFFSVLVLFIGYFAIRDVRVYMKEHYDDELIKYDYTLEDKKIIEKFRKKGYDFEEKDFISILLKNKAPLELIEQVVSYGVPVQNKHLLNARIKEHVIYLLDHGADVNFCGKSYYTYFTEDAEVPVAILIGFDDLEYLKLVKEKYGADLNIKIGGISLLQYYIRYGLTETAKNEAVEEQRDGYTVWVTPQSTYDKIYATVDFLSKENDVNYKDPEGETALYDLLSQCFFSPEENVKRVMEILFKNGATAKDAEPDDVCLWSVTMFHYGIEIHRMLKRYGANINSMDDKKRNALQLYYRNYYHVKKLVDVPYFFIGNGIDVNNRDTDGVTALQYLLDELDKENNYTTRKEIKRLREAGAR